MLTQHLKVCFKYKLNCMYSPVNTEQYIFVFVSVQQNNDALLFENSPFKKGEKRVAQIHSAVFIGFYQNGIQITIFFMVTNGLNKNMPKYIVLIIIYPIREELKIFQNVNLQNFYQKP